VKHAEESAVGAGVVELRLGTTRVWVGFVLTERGLRRVVIAGSPDEAAHAVGNPERRPSGDVAEMARRFSAYERGERHAFEGLHLDLEGMSAFGRRVLDRVRDIEFGDTKTYGEVAQTVGNPRAARAVGQIMAKNPIPIIIPCHRVVGSGGKLGGFSTAGGPDTKRRLLAHEGTAWEDTREDA